MQKPLTANSSEHKTISVILHDIRSSENAGSIFRTADAAGVDKIFLTGYTPAPTDRFKRKNAKLAKAALGAEETVAWEHAEDIFLLIDRLKAEDVQIVAVEQDKNAHSYMSVRGAEQTAFILGNEVDGIPKSILDVVDAIVEIPMHGKKESLNVSVAAGIILFHFRK
jgi:tRNA G18 (ribose-2'-O)-methylase SpoU